MIKCIQLVNGHDLIGDIEEQGSNYIVKDPAAIHMVPSQNGNGQFGIGLIPFMPFSETNKISVVKDKVVIEFEPSIEMRNNYSKMFGSGIEIANVMPR
jgi:hypothetical protein